MMPTPTRPVMIPRIPLAAVALLATLGLASCSSTPPEATEPTPAPTPIATETTAPVADPTPVPEEPTAAPTCETIVSSGTVSALSELGWTPQQAEFHLGEQVLDGGLYCAWADWTEPSDHGQFFAWAPLSDAQAMTAQADLLAQGWVREGAYITEPAASFQTDEDGYGMTYLFGDGWVTYADTKQSLLLIEWP